MVAARHHPAGRRTPGGRGPRVAALTSFGLGDLHPVQPKRARLPTFGHLHVRQGQDPLHLREELLRPVVRLIGDERRQPMPRPLVVDHHERYASVVMIPESPYSNACSGLSSANDSGTSRVRMSSSFE